VANDFFEITDGSIDAIRAEFAAISARRTKQLLTVFLSLVVALATGWLAVTWNASHSRVADGCFSSIRGPDPRGFLAKGKGRNRVQVHAPGDDELITRRREMDWVSRLRTALADGRMLVHAQRIAALAPGAELGERMELLVRLREVDGSIVPPMAFIPAAERYGIMPAIDRFVIRAAFEHLEPVGWRKQGPAWLIHPVVGSPDALDQAGRSLRRTHLDDKIDIAPVDPEIERRCANHFSQRREIPDGVFLNARRVVIPLHPGKAAEPTRPIPE